MYEGVYKIADWVIRVTSLYPDVHGLCGEYRSEETPALEISTTREDIDFESRKSAEEDRLEGKTVRIFPEGYLETLAVYRKLANRLATEQIMLFHGSVIAVDGVAYLFTAKSGTGKSTHTALWRKLFGERAVMINDDKPLLRLDGEQVIAYGTPWNGKHRLGVNSSAPLRAICILERGERNEITPISPREALPMLMQQSHRPTDAQGRMAYLEMIDGLASRVAFYRLRCNMDLEAAQVAFEGMQG